MGVDGGGAAAAGPGTATGAPQLAQNAVPSRMVLPHFEQNNFLLLEKEYADSTPAQSPGASFSHIHCKDSLDDTVNGSRSELRAGARENQPPMLDAPGCDQPVGQLAHLRRLALDHDDFQTVVMIQMDVEC